MFPNYNVTETQSLFNYTLERDRSFFNIVLTLLGKQTYRQDSRICFDCYLH